MSITPERTQGCQGIRHQEGDTGSPEVQVAILSERIRNPTEHMKAHKKDSTGPVVDAGRPVVACLTTSRPTSAVTSVDLASGLRK